MAVLSGDDSRSSADSQRQAADTAAVQRQPASIPDIIRSAFTPLGPDTVDWALRIASCESTNNPDAVNVSSGAEGLFQFLPSTWAVTPWANSSPFDPSANAQAAAWLYANSGGADNWECKA
jgi:soluble lytic murein transglycosylase-like protein